jgi:hypothetical protein
MVAILIYKKSTNHVTPQNRSTVGEISSTSHISESRNNLSANILQAKWFMNWKKSFSTPELAHSILTEQLKTQSYEDIVYSVDDEILIQYFMQQELIQDDVVNWKFYEAFMRKSLDEDPKLFVEYLKLLKTSSGSSMIQEATALVLLKNNTSDAEFLMNYFESSVMSISAYTYLKKFKESNYSYRESVEFLYKVYPEAAITLLRSSFTDGAYQSFSHNDKSMEISKLEKNDLMDFVKKNFTTDESADILTGLEKINAN